MPMDVRDAAGSIITIATPDEVIATINAANGKAVSAALTTPATGTTSVTLLGATTRKGCVIFNDAAATLYVKYGITASSTDYSVAVPAGTPLVVSEYIGRIDGILQSGTGVARVTELT